MHASRGELSKCCDQGFLSTSFFVLSRVSLTRSSCSCLFRRCVRPTAFQRIWWNGHRWELSWSDESGGCCLISQSTIENSLISELALVLRFMVNRFRNVKLQASAICNHRASSLFLVAQTCTASTTVTAAATTGRRT